MAAAAVEEAVVVTPEDQRQLLRLPATEYPLAQLPYLPTHTGHPPVDSEAEVVEDLEAATAELLHHHTEHQVEAHLLNLMEPLKLHLHLTEPLLTVVVMEVTHQVEVLRGHHHHRMEPLSNHPRNTEHHLTVVVTEVTHKAEVLHLHHHHRMERLSNHPRSTERLNNHPHNTERLNNHLLPTEHHPVAETVVVSVE